MSTAGIVFKSNGFVDVDTIIRNLFGSKVTEIGHPDRDEFDVRYLGNIMVEQYEDVYFICNTEMIEDLLKNVDKSPAHLYECLGKPELFMGYYHFPTGGSYGYTIIKNGVKVRTRLFATSVPEIDIDHGAHFLGEEGWINPIRKPLEEDDYPPEPWLTLFYQDKKPEIYHQQNNPEIWVRNVGDLVAEMLNDVLEVNFGVMPWETDKEPKYRFFLTDDAKLKDPTKKKVLYNHPL